MVKPVNKLTIIYIKFNNAGNVIECAAILNDGANFNFIFDILETIKAKIASIKTSINIETK